MKATISERLRSLPFYLLPHHGISWCIYQIARVRWRPLKNLAIRIYTRLHAVNMEEATISNKYAYDSLNAFFTRALKVDARPLADDPECWICPVDGTVSQSGIIENGRIFQAKGQYYSLIELLGGDDTEAEPFQNGKFATLYLSPRDYHRIHMPIDAALRQMTYVPGRLFSVAAYTVKSIPRLFARNERVVCRFDTSDGPMIMVLVGAINVSATETIWHGPVTGNGRKLTRYQYASDDVVLRRGDEMGRFNLGSTVILLTPEHFELDPSIRAGKPVRMGQTIGHAAA
ncbi:MAG: phosphatidylserine decarboxylase [Gammaproteobacteria bacterium]|nr:phosphatidylserine decarboxylase [Gammaproteobacteria bacterium]